MSLLGKMLTLYIFENIKNTDTCKIKLMFACISQIHKYIILNMSNQYLNFKAVNTLLNLYQKKLEIHC